MPEPKHTPKPLFDRTLGLLQRLTAISSPSGDPAGLAEAFSLYGQALGERGFSVEVTEKQDAEGRALPFLLAHGPRAGDHPLMVIGHLDTVLPAAEPELRDGRLYATGAIDMKGGLVAFVGALDLLAERGGSPPDDFLVAVVPDEEVAGHLSQWAMREYGDSARGLWVLEPGQPRRTGETVVGGRRGMFHWSLTVEGRSAHAGNDYWRGRSALEAAARWCVGARDLARPGDGPTVNAGRMVAGERGFLDDLEAHASLVGSGRQTNVVPDRAVVEGEARFLRRADGEALKKALAGLAQDVAREHEVEVLFEPGPVVAPVDPRGPSRAWADLVTGLAEKRGWTLEVEEDRGGISFPNFLPDPGTMPILDGLGPVGDGMHTRQEFLDLTSFDRRIALLADLMEADADR
ncbi:MAG: M20/M25/M40 family metallo-hydrolase [Acidobacteriota bacterium]